MTTVHIVPLSPDAFAAALPLHVPSGAVVGDTCLFVRETNGDANDAILFTIPDPWPRPVTDTTRRELHNLAFHGSSVVNTMGAIALRVLAAEQQLARIEHHIVLTGEVTR